LFFDQFAESASRNETLRQAAEVNSLEKFRLVFRQVLESLFIERMEFNEELFTDYTSKPGHAGGRGKVARQHGL